ncbi:MAG TPA: YcaO-like family protein [Pseudonocardia sp.]|jgi:ribosomal protein S12 methylthiotransferase accessory factor
MTATGPIHLTRPFSGYPALVFARTALRSAAFVGAQPSASVAAAGSELVIGAAAGTSEHEVRVRARAELIERMSNIVAGRRAEGTGHWDCFSRLTRQGLPAMDPREWAELAETPGIRERPMLWVPGVSLTHGGEVLVPACAVYLRHRPGDGSPALMSPGSAGLSAHRSVELARQHALLEVLERDLFWRAWYSDGPRAVIDAATLRAELGRLGLRRTTLLLAGPRGCACIVVCLYEPNRSRQSFGARAIRCTDEAAVTDATRTATHEALMVRWSLDTPSARAAAGDPAGRASPAGPLQHALHTFHRQDSLGHLLTHHAPSVPCDTGDAELANVVAAHTGHDVVWVDTVAHSDELDRATADSPLAVGRVVAPGARRLPANEARIPTPLKPKNQLPHPLG